jgi:hypothetical protein
MKFPDVTPSKTKDFGGSRSITRSSHIHALRFPPTQDQIKLGEYHPAWNIIPLNPILFL